MTTGSRAATSYGVYITGSFATELADERVAVAGGVASRALRTTQPRTETGHDRELGRRLRWLTWMGYRDLPDQANDVRLPLRETSPGAFSVRSLTDLRPHAAQCRV